MVGIPKWKRSSSASFHLPWLNHEFSFLFFLLHLLGVILAFFCLLLTQDCELCQLFISLYSHFVFTKSGLSLVLSFSEPLSRLSFFSYFSILILISLHPQVWYHLNESGGAKSLCSKQICTINKRFTIFELLIWYFLRLKWACKSQHLYRTRLWGLFTCHSVSFHDLHRR